MADGQPGRGLEARLGHRVAIVVHQVNRRRDADHVDQGGQHRHQQVHVAAAVEQHGQGQPGAVDRGGQNNARQPEVADPPPREQERDHRRGNRQFRQHPAALDVDGRGIDGRARQADLLGRQPGDLLRHGEQSLDRRRAVFHAGLGENEDHARRPAVGTDQGAPEPAVGLGDRNPRGLAGHLPQQPRPGDRALVHASGLVEHGPGQFLHSGILDRAPFPGDHGDLVAAELVLKLPVELGFVKAPRQPLAGIVRMAAHRAVHAVEHEGQCRGGQQEGTPGAASRSRL